LLRRAVSKKSIDVSEVLTATIIGAMNTRRNHPIILPAVTLSTLPLKLVPRRYLMVWRSQCKHLERQCAFLILEEVKRQQLYQQHLLYLITNCTSVKPVEDRNFRVAARKLRVSYVGRLWINSGLEIAYANRKFVTREVCSGRETFTGLNGTVMCG
jgi:hypothetical protein